MTTNLKRLYSSMMASMEVEGLKIPITAVKFFAQKEKAPDVVLENHITDITLTVCQAAKQASLGDAVCLSGNNIGCIAAGISLGLIDEREEKHLEGPRVYTDIMKEQSESKDGFTPPSPKDFTEGIVYACKDSGRSDFCLFGKNDSGRFKDIKTAKHALSDMTAIQPATTTSVFLYSDDFEEMDLIPDVVVLSVRPVELTRIIQAYQYRTGKRFTGSMGAVRAVCSDLIARPYLTQEVNISTYCLGARLIARNEADRLGIGIPFEAFKEIVKGMEDSKTGYPFPLYPGVRG